MARLLEGSRRVLLGMAFIAVMACTGGLIGAIGGVVAVLLSRAVLGMSTGMAEFMSGGIGVGAFLALMLGVFLMLRQKWPTIQVPGVTPASNPESQ